MVQIKITRARIIFEDGTQCTFVVDADDVKLMCLLDNGWLLIEDKDTTFFYPPQQVFWAKGVV